MSFSIKDKAERGELFSIVSLAISGIALIASLTPLIGQYIDRYDVRIQLVDLKYVEGVTDLDAAYNLRLSIVNLGNRDVIVEDLFLVQSAEAEESAREIGPDASKGECGAKEDLAREITLQYQEFAESGAGSSVRLNFRSVLIRSNTMEAFQVMLRGVEFEIFTSLLHLESIEEPMRMYVRESPPGCLAVVLRDMDGMAYLTGWPLEEKRGNFVVEGGRVIDRSEAASLIE